MENIIIKEDATDRISELPDGIIENILLRLDKPKERVQVSVLSKKWFALTASLPVLKFFFWDFVDEDWNSDNFYEYVKHTVSRFCRQQNVKIAHTFKLLTLAEDDTKLDIIDKCVELILLRGVKALDICIMKRRFSKCPPMYCLPNILSSVSTLTSLKISDCVMLPSSLMVGVVNFKSLNVLWLTRVPLNQQVIKLLSASCPLLEELVVECCYGLMKFCVYGRLQNLKTLRFIDYNENGTETIDIKAPNLCECLLSVGQGRGATSVILDSSKQRYLEKANKFKCLKLNNLFGMLSVNSELLKGTQLPPYELEHLELKMPIRHMLPVLDGLLWCFRPRSLSLTSSFSWISDEERSHFLKCISERLIQQEDQGPTNIRIEWSLPSKAKIYFSWNPMLTASCTQTLTFKNQGQKWRKKYQRRRFKRSGLKSFIPFPYKRFFFLSKLSTYQ
ncbi:F-box domain containing protein [Tanacetum coccineum]